MSTYKVALIGCGRRGNGNAKAVADNDRLEMIALSDPKVENAENLKEEYHFADATVYSDHKELLKHESPDLCVICVWTGLHLPIFRDCAEAGVKAVFLEKPMAATWGDSKEIARIAEETGCRLSFSHQRRFNIGNQNARKLVKDGLFGDIIRMDLFSPLGLLDCGTHSLDQAFSFLDDKVGVKWVLGAMDLSEMKDAFGVPDGIMFAGTMMYDNGILGNIYCSVADADHHTGVKIFGTKGFIEFAWGGEVNKYAVYDQPDWTPPEIVEEKPMKKSYEDIIKSMESDEINELHYSKALRATEVIFAFYESVRRRARIELPLEGVLGNPIVDLLEEMK